MNIKHHVSDGLLTIAFEGRIDSTNALEAEKDVNRILDKEKFERVQFDCAKLDYITSAGLRMVLAVWRKYPSLALINVLAEVYDIFDMTGFTRMLEIRKVMREISVDGLPIIGEGFTATVYRLDAETIVKVFKSARSIEAVRSEIDAAKKAFIYGIPTAISFDIVKVGDRLGLVFEMLDCSSLRDLIMDHPERFDEYKKLYADLSYRITHTAAGDSGLSHCKGPFLEKVATLEPLLTKEEYRKLMDMIVALPETETLTHGDFHIKNILVQNGEPILIDMDSVALGHPIFELEGIYLSFKAYNDAEPGNASAFFDVPQSVLDDLYEALLKTYFPGKSAEEMKTIRDKIELLSTAHLTYQTVRYHHDVNGRLHDSIAKIRRLLSKYDNLDLI